jgi:hypothetical protein
MSAGKVSGAFIQHVAVAANQGQIGTKAAELIRDGGADSPCCACNQRVLAGKRRALEACLRGVIGGRIVCFGHNLHD